MADMGEPARSPKGKRQTNPTHPDPVAEAGRQIAAIAAALAANEDRQGSVGAIERHRLRAINDTLTDRLYAIHRATTHDMATTMVGAMVHVMLACSDIDALRSLVPDDHQRDAAERQRRMERCLCSALNALAQASGVDPVEVGGDYYMPAALDPHRHAAEAMAERIGIQ